ncbi:hypothetical protein M0812_21582 [Anaeramoeba flamelloides]|uniref:Calcineurin-like phosphoesterase domain-containing protein n=1 Tax=Anaeramoeba flamelloides TaxID=1746091 RepID=A0AAV7YZ15_9EUKA|nr:hypothetical protein M0812_21582 [Anaeramoeba flamelloides]
MISLFTIGIFGVLILILIILSIGAKRYRGNPQTGVAGMNLGFSLLFSMAYNFLEQPEDNTKMDYSLLKRPTKDTIYEYTFKYFILFVILLGVLASIKARYFTNSFNWFSVFFQRIAFLFQSFLLSFAMIGLVLRIVFFQKPQLKYFEYWTLAFLAPTHIVGFIQTFYNPRYVINATYSPSIDHGSAIKRVSSIFAKKLSLSVDETEKPLLDKRNSINQSMTVNLLMGLKIVQLTDIHVGSIMTEQRLKRICKWAVSQNPDLILLTGDYLTIETNTEAGCQILERGLSPLKELSKDRIFAVLGNHDLEFREGVERVFENLQITLLNDEHSIVKIDEMLIEIVGSDFHISGYEYLDQLVKKFPKRNDVDLRILLLHDPNNFQYLPNDTQFLVLSGHTHGGLVGLNWLGLKISVVGLLMPDQGWFTKGNNLLYVHKGTGFYAPIRYGVTGEESIIKLKFESPISDRLGKRVDSFNSESLLSSPSDD